MEKIEVGEVFTITGEDNEENDVEVLAVITLEANDYVAVGFVDDILEESEEEIDVFFLKVDDDGDFSPIESDEEFEKVSNAFEDIMEAEED
ncbi:DUF1292 domain-containing protein [Metabacillus malikii]|uniref:Uncharacterized protein YrzB (UPF0473 family) n=1 Tax=Metabacillus malikii TaxID=1504265 RepID=A0ABT9ZCL5_9BACI|nr:DUF1292 domain-containing protein [Metabacillus malikii]MDQ0230004.1 uncharacterized protein YrzB (UPF0473 family) [Metabacillus malikii]